MRSCLGCLGDELFITQVGLQGLLTKYLKITLARQISPVTLTVAEIDLKDLNCVGTLTEVVGPRDKGRRPVSESNVFPASLICASFLSFLHNTDNFICFLKSTVY